MRFALVLDFADAVERWFGAAAWRWMLGHFVVAAALASLRPGMGLAFYESFPRASRHLVTMSCISDRRSPTVPSKQHDAHVWMICNANSIRSYCHSRQSQAL